MSSTPRTFDAWDIKESGPADAGTRVLLLPGGMCSTAFYDDLMAAPPLASAPVRLVAATLPGHAGTTPPHDLSMENYAALAGALAAERACDVVVGHSIGANVALEMAAGGHFTGPVVLLSPTFSASDEDKALAIANSLGRVPGIGALTWSGLVKLTPRVMVSQLPRARREALTAEFEKNDPAFCRQVIRHYFDYLDRYPDLVSRLRESGVPAWVVRGDRDDVGLAEDERAGLEAAPGVTLVSVPDAGHLVMVEQPDTVAELVARVALG
ncbi:alpha/beta hydrolase [Streptomyces sp. NBC_00659]|uniref:alpha/beta fold hydrolase n=1 Tax=Streptomyces sp. NBC_00659 TaxID=2903669 RepID=UPI002E333EF2|nr:alpha/beta hydrolase [Streptomyces sp. NBC_00659]